MPKSLKRTFFEGAVAGIALGVAASILLNSKKGKQLQETVKASVADFYKQVSPKLKKMGKLGQQEYQDFMAESAERYGRLKKMSEGDIKDLIEEAKNSWKHFSKEIKSS